MNQMYWIIPLILHHYPTIRIVLYNKIFFLVGYERNWNDWRGIRIPLTIRYLLSPYQWDNKNNILSPKEYTMTLSGLKHSELRHQSAATCLSKKLNNLNLSRNIQFHNNVNNPLRGNDGRLAGRYRTMNYNFSDL